MHREGPDLVTGTPLSTSNDTSFASAYTAHLLVDQSQTPPAPETADEQEDEHDGQELLQALSCLLPLLLLLLLLHQEVEC